MKRIYFLHILSILMLLSMVAEVIAQAESRIVVGPNILISSGRLRASGEYHIAADPTNPKRLLAVEMGPAGTAGSDAYYSHDGGYSWSPIKAPPDFREFNGDPQVGFGPTGTAYISVMSYPGSKFASALEGRYANGVFRSDDGGVTWSGPALYLMVDRPIVAVDNSRAGSPTRGNIYLAGGTSDHFGEKNGGANDIHIRVARSTNGGRTWDSVSALSNHEMPGVSMNSTPSPQVFSDGELFVPIRVYKDFSMLGAKKGAALLQSSYEGNADFYRSYFVSSRDGGVTFSPAAAILPGGDPGFTSGDEPIFALDNSKGPFKDRVYMVWADRGYTPNQDEGLSWRARAFVSYSSDRGKTWSRPMAVATDESPRGQQFMVSAVVNNEGTLGIVWYDTRNTPEGNDGVQVNQYFTASVDGGSSFLPARRVSSVGTEPRLLERNLLRATATGNSVTFDEGERSYGHYYGLAAAADGSFHAVWQDGRTGVHRMWTSSIRVENAGSGRASSPEINLVESDVTKHVVVEFDPIQLFSPSGVVELPVRLKNNSDRPIVGPFKIEVVSVGWKRGLTTKESFEAAAAGRPSFEETGPLQDIFLNAENKKRGAGAVFDYAAALGDLDALPPGGISDAVVWKIKRPATGLEVPNIKFKVTARVEKTDGKSPTNTSGKQ